MSHNARYAIGCALLATHIGDELVRWAKVNIHKKRRGCENCAVDPGNGLGERGALVFGQFELVRYNVYRHCISQVLRKRKVGLK